MLWDIYWILLYCQVKSWQTVFLFVSILILSSFLFIFSLFFFCFFCSEEAFKFNGYPIYYILLLLPGLSIAFFALVIGSLGVNFYKEWEMWMYCQYSTSIDPVLSVPFVKNVDFFSNNPFDHFFLKSGIYQCVHLSLNLLLF